MATYLQINELRGDSALLQRLTVAVERASVDILVAHLAAPQPVETLAWAKKALLEKAGANDYASRMLRIALHQAPGFADSATTLTDAQLQAVVNTYVPHFMTLGL